MIRNWMKMLLAILAGNLVYFALYRFWPSYLRHRLYAMDPGLIFDLTICIGIYLIIRKKFVQ
jgi:hypothetical protein